MNSTIRQQVRLPGRRYHCSREDPLLSFISTQADKDARYERGIDDEIEAPARRRLDMKKALNTVRSKYYDLKESVEHLPPAEADRVMKW